MDDFVSKPFREAALLAVLGRARSRPTSMAPTSNGPPSGPIIDRAALDTIRSLQSADRPNLLGEIVALYIATTPAEVTALGADCLAADWKSTRHRAHKLRGSSQTVGALRVGDVLGKLEEIAGSAEVAAVERLIATLQQVHAEAIGELARFTQSAR